MLNHELIQRKVKLIQEDLSRLDPMAHLSFDEVAKNDMKYGCVSLKSTLGAME